MFSKHTYLQGLKHGKGQDVECSQADLALLKTVWQGGCNFKMTGDENVQREKQEERGLHPLGLARIRYLNY